MINEHVFMIENGLTIEVNPMKTVSISEIEFLSETQHGKHKICLENVYKIKAFLRHLCYL